MDDFYFSVNLDNDRTLCLAPLTDRRIEMSGQAIEDSSGYFLYEQRNSEEFGGIEIIARVLNDDGINRLRSIFKMA